MHLLFASLLIPHPVAAFVVITLLLAAPFVFGMAVGPNTEIDLYTRIANLEAAVFQGGISVNPVVFQGGQSLSPLKFIAAGAITFPANSGTADLSGGTILAMTLVAPTAGLPTSGGDDGKQVVIFNDTAAIAHTITCPTNAIEGTKHVITFSSTANTFSAIELTAFGGVWYVTGNLNATLS